MSRPRAQHGLHLAVVLGRAAALGVLALGIAWTWRQWEYERAVAAGAWPAATRSWPAAAPAWRALAADRLPQDPRAAEVAARRAVAAVPADWRNWDALAQIQIERGEIAAARASMATMVADSHQFAASWADANLLLLANDTPAFWSQAARALAFVPADRFATAMSVCWQVADGQWQPVSKTIAEARAAAPSCAQVRRLNDDYFASLLDRDESAALADEWPRLAAGLPRSDCARGATAGDRVLGARYLRSLLAAGNGAQARRVWDQGRASGLFPAAWDPRESQRTADPAFAQPPAWPTDPLAWQLCSDCGPYVFAVVGGGLQLQFDGQQDAVPVLAQRWLLLAAGSYRLGFDTISPGAEPDGILVAVVNEDDIPLVSLRALAGHVVAARFALPPGQASYLLRVGYRRPLGEMPLRGAVVLRGLSLEPIATATAAGVRAP